MFSQISQNSLENTCARIFPLRDPITGFFPVNFQKFVGPLFLQSTFGLLLLYLEPCQVSMIEIFCGNGKSPTIFAKNPHHICLKGF